MTANNVLDLRNRYEIVGGEEKEYAFAVEANYAENLLTAYRAIAFYGDSQLSDSTVTWKTPQDLLTTASNKYSIPLGKSIIVQIGSVSFGKTRAVGAKEAKLKIDKATSKEYDVYLVDLATTLHNINANDVAEVSFRTQCLVKGCVAWELAPLRVGTEIEVQETLKTPSIEVDGIKVGEIYGRTINYKTLRPTIIAFGLREDDFSWSLRGDAIGMGSFVFMAAIGVPKGTKELQLRQTVGLKTFKYVWLEGDWAVSDSNESTIMLQP